MWLCRGNEAKLSGWMTSSKTGEMEGKIRRKVTTLESGEEAELRKSMPGSV